MVQKRIGRHLDDHQLPAAPHPDGVDTAKRRVRLADRRAKRCEIILAQQMAGGGVHSAGIERLLAPGDHTAEQRRAHRLVADHIAIGTRGRREPGMELARHFGDPVQAHRVRQPGIGAQQPVAGLPPRRRVEMDDLVGGVHAGVGAAGAGQGDGAIGHRRQHPLDSGLDTAAMSLALPAMKTAAVIFDCGGKTADTLRQLPFRWDQAIGQVLPIIRHRYSSPVKPASLASSASARVFCSSEPAASTSWRISRAPPWSPISR